MHNNIKMKDNSNNNNRNSIINDHVMVKNETLTFLPFFWAWANEQASLSHSIIDCYCEK